MFTLWSGSYCGAEINDEKKLNYGLAIQGQIISRTLEFILENYLLISITNSRLCSIRKDLANCPFQKICFLQVHHILQIYKTVTTSTLQTILSFIIFSFQFIRFRDFTILEILITRWINQFYFYFWKVMKWMYKIFTETNSNLNHQLYYHFLGTDQSEDVLCSKDPENPEFLFGAQVMDDGKLRPVNKLYYCDLSTLPNGLEGFKNITDMLSFVELVEIGSVYGVSGRHKDNEVFIGFTSFITPGIIYQCNFAVETPEMKIFREIVVSGFDYTEFQVNQVFVPSKDITIIPLFIVSKKNIILDGSHPCSLYGYGGFNISLTPSFSVSRTILTRHLGVVFCIANIRGAGSLEKKKQNCFDDFISAGEYLVSTGYTQSKKLCIEDGSNGGLVVVAKINQDEKYQYPPTMLLTADHDDRVVPLHSLKLLATMQYILCTSLENSPQTNPIIDVELTYNIEKYNFMSHGLESKPRLPFKLWLHSEFFFSVPKKHLATTGYSCEQTN
ncbi:hypothetical protein MKW92_000357 [Papaver armeniacum]|nr:hypothetical protein MKW92_000357 [Papaver armeniacum]